MMEADPRGSGSCVKERVEERPVGDSVGAIEHFFGFPVGAGYGTGVEMVAANSNGGGKLTFADEVVYCFAHALALAITEPADARGQALEGKAAAGKTEPAVEDFVLWKEFEGELVGAVDVFGVARESNPTEWTGAGAEERADVFRHEAR